MGIAVARVLATPDSLVILDLLHRKAIIADYNFIQKITGANLQLSNLQHLLIGNTLFPNIESACSVDSTPNSIQVLQQLTSTIVQKTIYTPNLKISQSIINESSKSQEMIVSYEQVHAEGNNLIPSNFNITINTSKKMYVSFDIKNFVFEKKKDLQFSIPKSYERVRL
jgi:phage-related protein